jgi:hypothetical protein
VHIILPGGKIIFFGGCALQNQVSIAHYNAEIFDPVSKSGTVVSGMNMPRIYHPSAILLLKGKVCLAGTSYAKTN